MATYLDIMQLPLIDEQEKQTAIIPQAIPFIKWAGGKRRMLHHILSMAPIAFKRYLEPFVGGGSVALALGHNVMLLNDANSELMTTYQVVRDELESLLPLLDVHKKKHSEDYFYLVRTQNPDTMNQLERAARFIYLNKTCFNGLYRVNKQGEFNVPFGQYKTVTLYNLEDIKIASRILKTAELFSEDYRDFLIRRAKADDFIYLDPPYVPVSRYSDFKRYTREQFREEDQKTLAHVYNDLIALGAYPVLSNSYSEFTLELYAQHTIKVIYANRNINHDGAGRAPIPEILVTPRITYGIH